MELSNKLRAELPEVEVFDDWIAAGPEADDYWRDYEKQKGNTYAQGLQGYAAKHVFSFDKHHLDTSDAAILVLPAGKSGHLELGYVAGQGKYTAILIEDPDRWDVMYQFADVVTDDVDVLITKLKERYEASSPHHSGHASETGRTSAPHALDRPSDTGLSTGSSDSLRRSLGLRIGEPTFFAGFNR
jgi:hypothetical protein